MERSLNPEVDEFEGVEGTAFPSSGSFRDSREPERDPCSGVEGMLRRSPVDEAAEDAEEPAGKSVGHVSALARERLVSVGDAIGICVFPGLSRSGESREGDLLKFDSLT